ncbi:prominin-like protein isoform X1 [Drosophila mojavensis]|uniref:Uncharacterized protein, isoform D n=1 Tax=Drosophila mojavensis TaxID=7230 RepID=A0A0Q9XBX0_DROMO|nr:prominin-like protein isoform X1 [Drosophila mojavensis]KRG03002.1 uncharacterized protein Dmoj_GI17428, isoform D [Drosophila mojavensis]
MNSEDMGCCSLKDTQLNYQKVRRIKQWNHLTISMLRLMIFLFMLDASLVYAKYASWSIEDPDFDTKHEKLGQPHYPYAELTEYYSSPKYKAEPIYNAFGMMPFHLIIRILFSKTSRVPNEYITVVNGTNALAFGEKSIANSWASLLCCNKLAFVWTIFLLFLIIVIPFVAITYFCFCFYRCPTVCECNEYADRRMRHFWSVGLMLLIVVLVFGLIVVMLNDKLIDQGVRRNWADMQEDRKDICTFLKDILDNIHHIFVYNFEEFETHINAQLNDVDKHILMDLSDASGLNALTELEEILSNMPQALALMKRVDKNIETLLFYIAQYRDGLRFVKRKMTYLLTVWCDYQQCNDILRSSGILQWDTSECLHLDLLPNISEYIESLQDIIRANLLHIPRQGIYNYQVVGEMIRENLHDQLPKISMKLAKLSEIYRQNVTHLQGLISSLINDIYTQHSHMSKGFHELEQSYGSDRKLISIALSVSILTITIILIAALICGWCVRRDNSGSKCLLLAMILISLISSLLLLVCLFYSIMGLIMYHAVCTPRTASEIYNVFNTHVNHTFNKKQTICRAHESIFDLLRVAGLYDVNNLRKEMSDTITPEYIDEFRDDLTKLVILTEEQKITLNHMRYGNLSDYNGLSIRKVLCHKLSQVDLIKCTVYLQQFANKFLYGAKHSLTYQYRINATINNMCLLSYDINQIASLQRPIHDLINRIWKDTTTIDELITRYDDFNNSILLLLEDIRDAEDFLHTRGIEYINALIQEFHEYLNKAFDKYVQYVSEDCKYIIGRCVPLAQIYKRSYNNLCHYLVDPINGYWFGLFTCALVFFPILFVAHKLLCLYRVYGYIGSAIIYLNTADFVCPACTDTPFVPAPYVISTGNQIHLCGCEDSFKGKDA